MLSKREQEFSRILVGIAESLDIPDTKYDQAVARYEAVGKWLDANDSKLHIRKPTIYPQGSFRLGTMVKPINDGDEYDIDLVCHLEIDKANVTQQELKEMVGDRLKEHEVYKKLLDEGRRCWTLNYANEFHMDILPAIPDYEKLNDAIHITDKKLKTWQHSNPKGYARWFFEKMKISFRQRKIVIAESMKANIEDIPDHRVRTPLQMAIQILKRHRDVCFKEKDYKPISIIITTLAASKYQNETDMYQAITNIIEGMSDVKTLKDANGKYYIPNPTNPDENFADKWNEEPALPSAFFKWLNQLRTVFNTASSEAEIYKMGQILGPALGVGIVDKAIAKFSDTPSKIGVRTAAVPKEPSHREFTPRTQPWGQR